MCWTSENARSIVEKVAQLKLWPPGIHSVDLVKAAVCPTTTLDCYESKCHQRKDSVTMHPEEPDDTVSWQQWRTVKEERTSKKKNVTVTVLDKISGTVGDLGKEFSSLIPKICHHIIVIKPQFKAYTHVKESSKSLNTTCTMLVDFSANFTCESSCHVQSAHFRASNRQLSLHTGVAYTRNNLILHCVWRHKTQPSSDLNPSWARCKEASTSREHWDNARALRWSNNSIQKRNRLSSSSVECRNFLAFSMQPGTSGVLGMARGLRTA